MGEHLERSVVEDDPLLFSTALDVKAPVVVVSKEEVACDGECTGSEVKEVGEVREEDLVAVKTDSEEQGISMIEGEKVHLRLSHVSYVSPNRQFIQGIAMRN